MENKKFLETDFVLPNKKERITPKGGWKQNTWYLVEIAMRSNNPLHYSILFTGFLNKSGMPGSYSGIIPTNSMPDCSDPPASYYETYYLRPVLELFTRESDGLDITKLGKEL